MNAGAAHSYVLRPDGTTRYLSELGPGDPVLVAGRSRPPRAVRIGRVKVERRPMVMAVADDRGTRRTVFLQEAESVRLAGPDGAIAATELAAGRPVLGVRLPAARHLGRAIDEAIEER
ncbi:3-dehydroquinate synthase [mine drainage metagenome]|uniref:3-dehydroquinate synthase n=1 Tax=mine drainage metagenome TaxID=410659 RepID=T1DCL2_9ZZZZ